MSARTPTIPSTQDNALDGELLDIRKRLAQLEALLNQKTGQKTLPPASVPPSTMPPTPGTLFIGEQVINGTANRVLVEDASGNLFDTAKFTFDDSTGALVVTAVDQNVTKAFRGTENTSSTNSSYSSFTAERISSGTIAAGFGVGYGFNAGQNGGSSIQWGAITCEYDGGATSSAMLFRITASSVVTIAAALFHSGQFSLQIAGAGFSIKTGSNCKLGQATLGAGGTVTVANTSVTASSLIFITPLNGANAGNLTIGTIVGGTSFVIQSDNISDRRVVNYVIFEPS